MSAIVIFDYDGVIVDSFDVFSEYFLKACKKEGIDAIGSKEEFLRLYEGNMYENLFKKGLSKEKILKIVYFMRDGLIENQDKINLFEGMEKTIKDLAEENKLYIVTSSEKKVVKKFLGKHKIETYFEDILGSDEEPSKIKKILKIKSLNDNDNLFYIGDTKGDIIEGKKAGVKTVGVSWGWHKKNKILDADPDFFVEKPEKILDLVN
ncbi:MAG: HAD family hydrolase [Candidatus Thermoplasmatota archaeon]